jgi:hypothetical protein
VSDLRYFSWYRDMLISDQVNVESVGQYYRPNEIFDEAIKLMLIKIEDVEKGLDELFAPGGTA